MVAAVILLTHSTVDSARLRIIVDLLNSVNIPNVSLVLSPTASFTNGNLDWFKGKTITHSSQFELESIAAGIEGLDIGIPGGVLIWAEGAEMISSQRVASLLHEFLKSPNEITLPSRAGARVLPVIFPLWVVDELRSGSPQTSLQKFLQLHPERVAEVPLDEHDFVIQSSQITASESGIMDDGR